MRNNLFRDTALLVAAVLLTTAFWSCSKSKEEAPEPTPPAVSVTGVTLDKSSINGASDVFLSDRKTKTDETRLLMRLCAHTHGIASESDAAGPLSTQNTSKIL